MADVPRPLTHQLRSVHPFRGFAGVDAMSRRTWKTDRRKEHGEARGALRASTLEAPPYQVHRAAVVVKVLGGGYGGEMRVGLIVK